MKENYFTLSNVNRVARVLRDRVRVDGDRKSNYVPARSVLLVLDMQRYFLDENSHAFIPSAPAIIPGLLRFIEIYVKHNLNIILTRHINTPESAGMMSKWWRDLITRENKLSEIDERFLQAGKTVIEKSQYDAFYQTNLESLLREKNITQVVITGVMTHLCCETTARSAFMRGFEVFFAVDGTATYNEEFHRASLMNLSHGFAKLVLIDELIKAIEDGCAE
ncbi:MAG: isochorismatase family protein [Candidatus Zixiibacteriota bacterium]